MVKIDEEKCINCGSCESICPDVFERKDGKIQIKVGADITKPCIKEAKEICSMNAITI